MRKTGRFVAVAAITPSAVGLAGGGAQGAESLTGKWHGDLRVDENGSISNAPYTLWIRSTQPGNAAGKSSTEGCVGRLTALGTSRGSTRFVDLNYKGPSECTNGDRFAVRLTSDGRLRYRGRSTTGLRATGLLKRKR